MPRKKAETENIETGNRPEETAGEHLGGNPDDMDVERPIDIHSTTHPGHETDSERRHRIYLDLLERNERERRERERLGGGHNDIRPNR